jgi:Peptidase M50B-like
VRKTGNKIRQGLLIPSTLVASWLGMQAVHELGHVVGAWVSGGRVAQVVLYPLTISRTDLAENPHPLFVVWAGPVVGVLLPLVFWGIAAAVKSRMAFLLRFFAGFCLLANGLYIGVGSFERVGDCREMLRYGSTSWQLWLFGVVTAPIGLWLWHGQGRHFGLGAAHGEVDRTAVVVSVLACGALVVLGLLVGQ